MRRVNENAAITTSQTRKVVKHTRELFAILIIRFE